MEEIASKIATFEWWQMSILVLCVGGALGEILQGLTGRR